MVFFNFKLKRKKREEVVIVVVFLLQLGSDVVCVEDNLKGDIVVDNFEKKKKKYKRVNFKIVDFDGFVSDVGGFSVWLILDIEVENGLVGRLQGVKEKRDGDGVGVLLCEVYEFLFVEINVEGIEWSVVGGVVFELFEG